jgi:hypothetical protein
LGTDLTQLIPRSEELLAPPNQVRLDKEMMKQIEEAVSVAVRCGSQAQSGQSLSLL